MRRLLRYMAPYKWWVVLALGLVAVVTPLELAPPLDVPERHRSLFRAGDERHGCEKARPGTEF